MKPGDIVEWRGVNHMVTGKVVPIGNSRYLVVSTRWGNFQLHDVRHSPSFRVLYNENDK